MFFCDKNKTGRAAPHRRPSWGRTKSPISVEIHWKSTKIQKSTPCQPSLFLSLHWDWADPFPPICTRRCVENLHRTIGQDRPALRCLQEMKECHGAAVTFHSCVEPHRKFQAYHSTSPPHQKFEMHSKMSSIGSSKNWVVACIQSHPDSLFGSIASRKRQLIVCLCRCIRPCFLFWICWIPGRWVPIVEATKRISSIVVAPSQDFSEARMRQSIGETLRADIGLSRREIALTTICSLPGDLRISTTNTQKWQLMKDSSPEGSDKVQLHL